MKKVFCKKKLHIGDQNRSYNYEVGEWYDMKISNSEICHVMDHDNGWLPFEINDDIPSHLKKYNDVPRQDASKTYQKNGGVSCWCYYRFSEHFQTIQEIRKLKLKQINKTPQ